MRWSQPVLAPRSILINYSNHTEKKIYTPDLSPNIQPGDIDNPQLFKAINVLAKLPNNESNRRALIHQLVDILYFASTDANIENWLCSSSSSTTSQSSTSSSSYTYDDTSRNVTNSNVNEAVCEIKKIFSDYSIAGSSETNEHIKELHGLKTPTIMMDDLDVNLDSDHSDLETTPETEKNILTQDQLEIIKMLLMMIYLDYRNAIDKDVAKKLDEIYNSPVGSPHRHKLVDSLFGIDFHMFLINHNVSSGKALEIEFNPETSKDGKEYILSKARGKFFITYKKFDKMKEVKDETGPAIFVTDVPNWSEWFYKKADGFMKLFSSCWSSLFSNKQSLEENLTENLKRAANCFDRFVKFDLKYAYKIDEKRNKGRKVVFHQNLNNETDEIKKLLNHLSTAQHILVGVDRYCMDCTGDENFFETLQHVIGLNGTDIIDKKSLKWKKEYNGFYSVEVTLIRMNKACEKSLYKRSAKLFFDSRNMKDAAIAYRKKLCINIPPVAIENVSLILFNQGKKIIELPEKEFSFGIDKNRANLSLLDYKKLIQDLIESTTEESEKQFYKLQLMSCEETTPLKLAISRSDLDLGLKLNPQSEKATGPETNIP